MISGALTLLTNAVIANNTWECIEPMAHGATHQSIRRQEGSQPRVVSLRKAEARPNRAPLFPCYRSPGGASGPAIAIVLIYAGRASTRLTYETTFGKSSMARPPNRGSEVRRNITITSAQVKSDPAK
jgi:hypothetical protein